MSLAQDLRRYGLFLRGVTRLDADELEACGLSAARPMLALVGNIGSSYWPVFSRAAEFADGREHPLDRWSRRVAGEVAMRHGLTPAFPFDGPPYLPFQRWARRAERLAASPLGILIHPEHGLWHSYRFALLGESMAAAAEPPEGVSPCLDCDAKPCLVGCPVDAFDGSTYHVGRCAAYLRRTPGADCLVAGCLARRACPVAPELAYVAGQGRFHLQAFLQARERE